MFLEVSQNLQENTRARFYFLIKLQPCSFIKKQTLEQGFSWEFCELPKNTFSQRTAPAAAFEEMFTDARHGHYGCS